MDKKSTGPYQHYERPTGKRSPKDNQPSGSARWIAVIVILAVILIALIPIVHRLASDRSEKAEEVQTVKKVSSKSSTKKKISSSTSVSKKKKSAATSSSLSSSSSSESSTPKTYVVQSGDTLTDIAQKNGLTVDQLAKLNNLEDSSNVEAGQTLKLR